MPSGRSVHMRAFIAIDFCDELKKHIANLQSELRLFASSGRWKYIDNFHLTLKFLGEIRHEAVLSIDEKMKIICADTARFSLKIGKLGCFSSGDTIRVLWLGLDGDLDKLAKLKADIDERFYELGFAKEKRGYTPHITIGQDISFERDFASLKRLVDTAGFPEIMVDRVYLFKSELIQNKRVYTPISEYRLRM